MRELSISSLKKSGRPFQISLSKFKMASTSGGVRGGRFVIYELTVKDWEKAQELDNFPWVPEVYNRDLKPKTAQEKPLAPRSHPGYRQYYFHVLSRGKKKRWRKVHHVDFCQQITAIRLIR